jgi:preprotein translocase subunit SecA
MNQQREIIYSQRKKVLDGENLNDFYLELIGSRCREIADELFPHDRKHGEAGSFDSENDTLSVLMSQQDYEKVRREFPAMTSGDEFYDSVFPKALDNYHAREKMFGDGAREAERIALLYAVDKNWMEHIDTLDQLRTSIGLRAIGQHDPVIEYQNEAFELFDLMNDTIRREALRILFSFRIAGGEKIERRRVATESHEGGVRRRNVQAGGAAGAAIGAGAARSAGSSSGSAGDRQSKKENDNTPATFVRDKAKVGRNDPCPCGSGKKYKNCCGKNAED